MHTVETRIGDAGEAAAAAVDPVRDLELNGGLDREGGSGEGGVEGRRLAEIEK